MKLSEIRFIQAHRLTTDHVLLDQGRVTKCVMFERDATKYMEVSLLDNKLNPYYLPADLWVLIKV